MGVSSDDCAQGNWASNSMHSQKEIKADPPPPQGNSHQVTVPSYGTLCLGGGGVGGKLSREDSAAVYANATHSLPVFEEKVTAARSPQRAHDKPGSA